MADVPYMYVYIPNVSGFNFLNSSKIFLEITMKFHLAQFIPYNSEMLMTLGPSTTGCDVMLVQVDTLSAHKHWQGDSAFKHLPQGACVPAVIPWNGSIYIYAVLPKTRSHSSSTSHAAAKQSPHVAPAAAAASDRWQFCWWGTKPWWSKQWVDNQADAAMHQRLINNNNKRW